MRDSLLLEYSHLGDGESQAGQLCPICRGGSTGEHSLSVSRNGNTLLWRCHRASCGYSGRSGSKATRGCERTNVPSTRGIVGRQYYRESEALPSKVVEELVRKYHLNEMQLSLLGWDADVSRVTLPILNMTGDLLGCVLRSENGATPKALMYAEENSVALFRNFSSDKLIIVEDIYSAIRASEYMNAAAILGTHINDERIDTLRKMKCNKVYLALDADAFDKTIKFATKFRSSLAMTPVKLEKDLKNHTHDELKEFFNDLT